ncbi:SGNH/GDSL hydrolase family protein [Nocardioides ochotonae]|uniref:SGNH/GDSL hydrolase family protein n=1 Tax=Nocardioides ochotonae TaxID=2685869 RepID=UPI00140763C7|nr:GDSL-type esterase/lipase family protein [Nocardioides ochotonae]
MITSRAARPAPSVSAALVMAALALLAVLLAPLAAVPAAAAESAGPGAPAGRTAAPLRVMFVGDSITQGRTGDTTYRYWVWRALAQQSVPVTFVGPTTGLRGGDTYLRTDLGFATAHAAAGGSGYADHLPLLRKRVRTHRPDVIVLGLGFNDARAHGAAQILADARRYLRRTWRIDPRIRFVLNEVTTSSVTKQFTNNRRLAVTRGLRRLAAGEDRVQVARIVSRGARAWVPEVHTYDGTHPTPTGETSIAHGVVRALLRHGIVPEARRVFTRREWDPRLAVADVAVDGLRLTASVPTWRSVSARDLQVLALDPEGRTVAISDWTAAARVSVSVPGPGTYSLRVVARRGTMTGVPGPATPVQVD